MKRLGLVVAAGLLALAWSQAPLPPAAGLYDAVLPKVLEAKRILEADPAQALVLVEDAQKAFAEGSASLPPVIAAGIEQALKDARISVARRSKADLEGRLWVLRGAFAKALYDAFFEAVAGGDREIANALLERLVEASARPDALRRQAQALAERGDLEGLRSLFERAYLNAIVKSLELAGDGENRTHAYALVSKAYGLFLIVQDSPRVGEVRPKDFIDVLAALAGGDLEAYRERLRDLSSRLTASLEALPAAPAPAPPEAPPPGPRAEPVERPAAPAPEPAPPPAAMAPPPPPPPPPGPRAEVRTFRAPAWMDPGTRALVESRAGALGYLYLSDFLDTVRIVLDDIGAASALLGSARMGAARERLDRAWWRYATRVEPVLAVVEPEMAPRVAALLERLRRVPGVRTTDLTTLYALVASMQDHFLRGKPDRINEFWLGLQAWMLGFTGLPRAVFFLLAGALAIFPLLLIRLTFGGRNVYWRLLGFAFFFLLLPAILEGITYLGDILANYGGLPQLSALINLSLLQSLPAQIGWGITVFLVIVLAGWGLRGIAHQFGLIGERRGAAETAPGRPSPTVTSESVIEWDEEF